MCIYLLCILTAYVLQLMEHEFRDAEMALTLAEMRSDLDNVAAKRGVQAGEEAAGDGDTAQLLGSSEPAATHASAMLMKVIQRVESAVIVVPQLTAPAASEARLRV